jgi:hypothetical protein
MSTYFCKFYLFFMAIFCVINPDFLLFRMVSHSQINTDYLGFTTFAINTFNSVDFFCKSWHNACCQIDTSLFNFFVPFLTLLYVKR